jgi:hypothetical protein
MGVTKIWPSTYVGAAEKRNGPFGFRHYTIIYALKGGDRIKFGRTLKFEKRLGSLRTASPVPIEPIGHIWMPDETEAAIFHFLHGDRCHGEWFYVTERTKGVAALIGAQMHKELAEAIGMEGMLQENSRPRPREISDGKTEY